MKMKQYVTLWFIFTLYLAFEAWALNFLPAASILSKFSGRIPYIPEGPVSPEPGRPLSLWYGWIGLSLILLTNFYVFRKRWGWFNTFGGSLPGWLDFHIFCGLMGPTFILFHSNFKVRGLVAISFWSMIVSVTSGVIGRYLYLQLLTQKSDLEKNAQAIIDRIHRYRERVPGVTEQEVEYSLNRALEYLWIPTNVESEEAQLGLTKVFLVSLMGDIKRLFGAVPGVPGFPISSSQILEEYAIAKRRIIFLRAFQKLMGYWHTFHAPFAFFMYGAAIIHVITALLLGVRNISR